LFATPELYNEKFSSEFRVRRLMFLIKLMNTARSLLLRKESPLKNDLDIFERFPPCNSPYLSKSALIDFIVSVKTLLEIDKINPLLLLYSYSSHS